MTNLQIINLSKKLDLLLADAPIILCIGSKRVVGDSLGPFTGELLTKVFRVPTFVYGDLSRPVNATNLSSTLLEIEEISRGKKLLVVDAGVGKGGVGRLSVRAEGIYPGAADGKKFPKVGDVSITASVCETISKIHVVDKPFILSTAFGIAKAISLSKALSASSCNEFRYSLSEITNGFSSLSGFDFR